MYLPSLWPYSDLLCAALTRHGYWVSTLPPSTPQSLALGRAEAVSKEYLSFTAQLGAVLKKAGSAGSGAQFLLPCTEDAEADARYSRAIRAILDRKGYGALLVISPVLEGRKVPLCQMQAGGREREPSNHCIFSL